MQYDDPGHRSTWIFVCHLNWQWIHFLSVKYCGNVAPFFICNAFWMQRKRLLLWANGLPCGFGNLLRKWDMGEPLCVTLYCSWVIISRLRTYISKYLFFFLNDFSYSLLSSTGRQADRSFWIHLQGPVGVWSQSVHVLRLPVRQWVVGELHGVMSVKINPKRNGWRACVSVYVSGWRGDADPEAGLLHRRSLTEQQDPGAALRSVPHARPAQALREDWGWAPVIRAAHPVTHPRPRLILVICTIMSLFLRAPFSLRRSLSTPSEASNPKIPLPVDR